MPGEIFRLSARDQAFEDNEQKKDNNARASQEAELLSRYRKNEVGLDFGNKVSFIGRRNIRIVQSLAGQHAAADRGDRVVLLSSVVVVLVQIRVEESHDSLALVIADQVLIRLSDYGHKAEAEHDDDREDGTDDLVAQTCNVIQNTENDGDRQSVFKVRLQEDQDQRKTYEACRPKDHSGLVHIIFILHEIFGEKDDQDDLGELNGLKTQTCDRDPSRRATGIVAEDNDQKKQQDVEAVTDPVEVHDPGKIRQRYDEHDGKTEHDTRQLPPLQRGLGGAYEKYAERREGH